MRYALIDDASDAETYVETKLPAENVRHSWGGEMTEQFSAAILEQCATLVLCGHTGNICHHTAFQLMVKGFEDSQCTSLTITLPAFAISNEQMDYGEALSENIAKRAEREGLPIFPFRLGHYRDCFGGILSKKEVATIGTFEEYLLHVLARAPGHYSLLIQVDDCVIGGTSETGKTLRVVIQNKAAP